MQKGKINVQTENIFPIIKKFLYSDHEIFLRELISNAVDATQKLKTLASLGKFKGELGDIKIKVVIDKENKTLTVKDQGVGMTTEEVDKYINQIALSSAEDFVKKFKTKTEAESNAIIGHFGLGFYSSFMVSDKVEINSKTYKKGGSTKAVKWECDGSPEYFISESDRKERGTDITLHIAEDSIEFLEEQRILGLLNKYCKFLPVEIEFGTESIWEESKTEKDGKPLSVEIKKPRIINNTNPLWRKKPSKLKKEDYLSFYRELYPMQFDEPLFNIHLNVDYPFNLTGVLYFPKIKNNVEVQRDKIQLFSNQVFVTDSVEGIVPDFLTLLHGVLDSPDIPLNVSRSFLQSDRNVKKISNHIMKKVADKLEKLYKNENEEFKKKWDDIKIFIQYGMISEEKFYERASKFALFKNIDGAYFKFDEYKKHIEATQTDKDKILVILYANNLDEQHSYIKKAQDKGYDVLLMDSPLDNHFVNTLEQKMENTTFARVDADIIDKLIQKEEQQTSKLSEEEQKTLKEAFEANVEKEKYNVVLESISESDMPVLITQPEFMRRMKDMNAMGGGGGMMMMGDLPETYQLIVNTNHKLSSKILKSKDKRQRNKLIKQIIDIALLAQNMLKGEKLTKFIERSVKTL